jgi:hypothetical protein
MIEDGDDDEVGASTDLIPFRQVMGVPVVTTRINDTLIRAAADIRSRLARYL